MLPSDDLTSGIQPDLPIRLEKDIPLTPYDREIFYTNDPKGYNEYGWAKESIQALADKGVDI